MLYIVHTQSVLKGKATCHHRKKWDLKAGSVWSLASKMSFYNIHPMNFWKTTTFHLSFQYTLGVDYVQHLISAVPTAQMLYTATPSPHLCRVSPLLDWVWAMYSIWYPVVPIAQILYCTLLPPPPSICVECRSSWADVGYVQDLMSCCAHRSNCWTLLPPPPSV
jgi:hypothetical protein